MTLPTSRGLKSSSARQNPLMSNMADDFTRLVRTVVTVNGGDPEMFRVWIHPGVAVCVRGPCGFASYRLEGWLADFTRHYESGYFSLPHCVDA